jgi:hypothetical protein
VCVDKNLSLTYGNSHDSKKGVDEIKSDLENVRQIIKKFMNDSLALSRERVGDRVLFYFKLMA